MESTSNQSNDNRQAQEQTSVFLAAELEGSEESKQFCPEQKTFYTTIVLTSASPVSTEQKAELLSVLKAMEVPYNRASQGQQEQLASQLA